MTPLFDSRAQVEQSTCLGSPYKKPLAGSFIWGAVVEDIRTTFERLNNTSIYIPAFSEKITFIDQLK